MMPATMPARSWSLPRVADTLLTSEMSNASGSAPYFRTLARSVAVCCVKLPEICAAPPGIAVLTEGAEIDLPSRTIANRFIGSVLVASARVAFSNCVEPSALNCRLTTHSIPFCGMPALALVSWLPSMRVGPSRYFSVPVRSQENSGWSETSTWGSPHVKLAKSDWSDWLGCQSMALSGGVPWPTSVGRGAVGVGGAVGSWGATIGRLLPTEASPLPPLPAVVGSGTAVARADGTVGSPLGAGVGVALPVSVEGAVAGGWTCSAAYTARNLRTAVWPTCWTSWSCWTFGTLTMIWRSPETVTSLSPTPSALTRCSMMVRACCRLLGSMDPLPELFRAVRVTVVPPRRSRPSFGDQVLPTAIRVIRPAITTRSAINNRNGRPVMAATSVLYLVRHAPRAGRSSAGRTRPACGSAQVAAVGVGRGRRAGLGAGGRGGRREVGLGAVDGLGADHGLGADDGLGVARVVRRGGLRLELVADLVLGERVHVGRRRAPDDG